VTVAISGTDTYEQMADNLGALALKPPKEDLDLLERVSAADSSSVA
jgi:aryl-alcohol dehydrogenase-like predicted oxidoreductase